MIGSSGVDSVLVADDLPVKAANYLRTNMEMTLIPNYEVTQSFGRHF